jgi:hypothetical protein
MTMRFRFFPVLLIAFGSGLLLTKLGILPGAEIRELFHTWWPALLVALGVSMLLFPRQGCRHSRHHHRMERTDEEAKVVS